MQPWLKMIYCIVKANELETNAQQHQHQHQHQQHQQKHHNNNNEHPKFQAPKPPLSNETVIKDSSRKSDDNDDESQIESDLL